MIYIGFYYSNDEVIWKKIYFKDGTESNYSVSNIGLIRNDNKNKILKTNFVKGYERVGLIKNGKQKTFLVHRLVATAFIPNPENKPEVNHKNGKKYCNYVDNLEWVTSSENIRHAIDTGLNKFNHKNSIKRADKKKIKKICKLLEKNELSISQIANKVGVSRNTVSDIQKKRRYTNISSDYNIDKYEIKTDFSKSGDLSERTIYSDSKIHEVCKLIDSCKYDLQQISKMTGVHYQTVRNVYYGTCRHDVSKHYKFMQTDVNPLYEERKKSVLKVCELLEQGLTSVEISKKVNMSSSNIRRIRMGKMWKEVSKDFNFRKTYIPVKRNK